MANPDPEITPEEVAAARPDAIIATGRSDYPNQINNVLGFPYIFRGALDVRAKTINMEMKIAAAQALAELAREDVPDEVAAAYRGARPRFGRDYIIPVPFDPRLISVIPPAVAKAAMESGVARRPIVDMDAYRAQLVARGAIRPPASLQRDHRAGARAIPKRVVFAEGEEEQVIRAALSFVNAGLGTAILVGREDRVRQTRGHGAAGALDEGIEIHNARLSSRNAVYAQFLYERLQRKGFLLRDCQRLVNQDRNHFAAAMVAQRRRRRDGHRRDAQFLRSRWTTSAACIDPRPGHRRDRRVAGAGARAHRVGRRHRDHRNAGRRGPRRDRHRGGAASRAASATSRGSRCWPSRPSAIRPANAPQRVQEAVRILDSAARRFRI